MNIGVYFIRIIEKIFVLKFVLIYICSIVNVFFFNVNSLYQKTDYILCLCIPNFNFVNT